ncbi:MAG: chitobiase/beta-hexosaminidase C-terminal domain-containing protein [Verrucomicrobia bacterium]|nr:chitobiase/beta-hexosaminidase C-terminal domain-containing protein [Verrucomicrobiota bacterium]
MLMTVKNQRGLCLLALATGIALLATAQVLRADGTVTTLGGAGAGWADGNTFELSLFDNPAGVAADNAGNLLVADRDNNAIRLITAVGDDANSQTITILSNLPSPLAVTFDAATNFYVLTAGDGLVRQYNSFGNFITHWPALTKPTALAIDARTNIYVTLLNGAVVKLNPTNSAAPPVVVEPSGTFNQPQGIAALSSGQLAVSDTGNHAVQLVNPLTGAVQLLAGGNGPGYTNGPPPYAAFNQPWQLFQAPNGAIVVADRGNNRVRVILINGAVTNLYGVSTNQWDYGPGLFPGWYDGVGADFGTNAAACRDPVGVTVDRAGVVYTTEDYYHLLREVTGSGLTGASGAGGSTSNTVVVLPPTFSPNSGYFPMGQTITVSNLNNSLFFNPTVYYTTDGTDPTTNSLQLALTNNLGVILWHNSTNDLTALKLKAFIGSFASATVSGLSAATNTVGIPPSLNGNVLAGIGSTIVLPVVVNLGSNQTLASIQYRLDLTPEESPPGHFAPNIPTALLQVLPLATNDFIPLTGPSASGGSAQFGFYSQSSTNTTTGQVTNQIGILSSPSVPFTLRNFGAVGLLAVPIPATAQPGDRYRLELKFPEGTSDANQASVPLASLPDLEIVVSTNVCYLVGDTAPSFWYNAETGTGFGEGNISNDDVNNVFLASLGVRVPFPFTDLFDAMDVFPEDTPTAAGGDGRIRFLDWQITLDRALRFQTNNWMRYWGPGGVRVTSAATLTGSADTPAEKISDPLPGVVWVRQALLRAGAVPAAVPGTSVNVPIYLNVAPGASVAGMEFSVVITNSTPGAAQVSSPVTFSPAPALGIPAPQQTVTLAPNGAGWAWSDPSFDPPLEGSNLVGQVSFTLPSDAPATSLYTVQFVAADGAPAPTNNTYFQYDFETSPGAVAVRSTNLPPPAITSVEWRTNFFGSADNPLAADNADPDGDGMPNWAEYLAGTNPTNALSRLQLAPLVVQTNGAVVLRWLSAPYRAYAVETAPSPTGANWSAVATNVLGTGDYLQIVDTNSAAITRFYRVRLQP